MPKILSEDAVQQYERDGYTFPIRAMSAGDALHYRKCLEVYEQETGGPISSNMRRKTHLLFRWANELIRHPKIVDAVEDILGPDILCWASNFFIKEANTPDFVAWHQDATYWGLSSNDVVTVWIALTDAPVESGAMKFLPGSHRQAVLEHRDTFDDHNLLTRGQEIAVDVPDDEGVYVPLKAGEFSLHHVLLVHGSEPNTTNDRRIGLAIRYIPTHVRQLKADDTAMLVRGIDVHNYFNHERDPIHDLDEAALAAHAKAINANVKTLYSGTDKTVFRA